jgi:rhamnose transport system permease protein
MRRPAPPPGFVKRIWHRWELLLVALIVATTVWCVTLSPDFFKLFNLLSLPLPIIYVGLMALGLTPVIVAGDIDISVTSTLAVSAVTCAQLWQSGVNIWVATFISLVVATALGTLNGLLCTFFGVTSLAITLGTMGAYSGVAYLILPNGAIGLPSSFTNVVDAYIANKVPVGLVFFAGCCVAIGVLLHKTSFGRYLYMQGSSPEVARFTAVPVQRTRVLAFALSGFMAGLASVAYMGYFSEARSDVASTDLITAITIVVLGGIDVYGGSGAILGLVLAFVLVAEVDNGMDLANIQAPLEEVAIGCILVGALLFGRSRLAFGKYYQSRLMSRERRTGADYAVVAESASPPTGRKPQEVTVNE